MRFLTLSITVAWSAFAIGVQAAYNDGFFNTIQLPKDMVPETCKKGVALAVNEDETFYYWLMEQACQQSGFKINYQMVEEYIDPVMWDKRHGLIPFIYKRLGEFPISLSDVRKIYGVIMTDCVKNKREITNNANFCNIQHGDSTLTKVVNECIIPKVVARFMFRVPEMIAWSKTHCHKVEQIVKEFLIDTRSKDMPQFQSISFDCL